MKRNNELKVNENNTKEKLIKNECCERKQHGFFGGIILILIGVILLFNNFDLLPWSVWLIIWKFWPFFLIIGGIEMVVGRNWLAKLIIGLTTLFIIIFISIQVFAFNNYSFKIWVEKNLPWLPLNEKIFNVPKKHFNNRFFEGEGFEN